MYIYIYIYMNMYIFSLQAGSVCLAGSAKYIIDKKILSIGRKKNVKNVLLCTMVKSDSNIEIVDLWKSNVLKKSTDINKSFTSESGNIKKKNEKKNVLDKLYTQVISMSYNFH
jgi:hypothetical protein